MEFISHSEAETEALGEKLIELFQNGYEEDEFMDDPDEQE